MKKHKRVNFAGQGINFLTRQQMEEIHSCTLQLLQETGILVQHKGALEMLEKAGCRVEKKHVYMPPTLVEWAIKAAPSRILLYDRDGRFALDVSGRNTYYGVGSSEPRIIDSFTGETRLCNEEDNKNCVKVADAMPYIDYMMSQAQVYGHPKTSYEHEYAAMIRYSSKPQVVITADLESTKNVVEMASVVRGGLDKLQQKPLFILYCEPTSPLNCTRESIEKVMYMAENGLPVLYAPIPMNGATSPVTLAGANIVHDVGYTTFGLAHSNELVVMMNDAIGRVRRIFDCVNTTPDYLAMDDMREVGPKGHFLGQESTLRKNCENWESTLEDRNEYDRWMELGGKTMGQRANERVRDIIENGKLNSLPADLDAKIVAIIERIDAAEAESMK